MKDCNCNRSNQGRALCPTPERCDAEETHMVNSESDRLDRNLQFAIRLRNFSYVLLIVAIVGFAMALSRAIT